jgi:hypothetical protein
LWVAFLAQMGGYFVHLCPTIHSNGRTAGREGDIRCGTAETGANVSKRTSLALSMGEN